MNEPTDHSPKRNAKSLRELLAARKAEAEAKLRGKTLATPQALADHCKAVGEEAARKVAESMAQPGRKKKPGRSPAARDAAHAAKGRLPDGTTQSQTWLAGRGVWVCEMTVPTGIGDRGEPQLMRFYHQGKTLFGTLVELDDKYRAWLAQTPGAVATVATAAGGPAGERPQA